MVKRKVVTRDEVINSVSAGLIEFGYPDAKPPKISEVLTAYQSGKRGAELPHGVIGRFAESQFDQLAEAGLDLSSMPAVEA